MNSLVILFAVLATIAISFSVPGIVLSAPSIAGALAAGLFLILIYTGVASRLRKHPVDIKRKAPCFVGPSRFF